MEKRIEELALMLKKGSKIHIKKENRGKFTDYCGGKVTSECISRGKNSPDPKIRKRATFAANARKWKHADGGTIDGDVSFEGIKTTNNRPYNPVYISYINTKLRDAGMGKNQRLAVLSNIIEESGGDPFAEGPGGFYGLLQWSPQRYKKTGVKNVYEELDNQINYILNTVGNATDRMSWTHGGKGSGYNSLTDAMDAFSGDDLTASMRGFTLGYVRPAGGLDSLAHRMRILNQLNSIKGFYKKGGKVKSYATGNTLVYNPLGASNQNTELSPYGTLTYKPFVGVQSTGDPMLDFIYEGFTPSFPVEPVNTPVEQKDDNKEDSKISSPTVEIDISGPEDIATGIEEPTKVEDTIIEVEDIPTEIAIPVQTQNVAPEQNNNPNRPIRIPRPQQQFSPPENTTAPADATNVAAIKIPKGKIEYARPNIQVGNMQELINLMVEEGISFRITSGYRPDAKTKQGRPSHHGAGNAIDITPIKGQTWDDLLSQMRRSKRFLDYMRSHKLGILDERSKEMLAQTGGTGAHFHIGPDRAAVANFEKLFA